MTTLYDVMLENDPDAVGDVVESLLRGLGCLSDESENFGFQLAIHEMLLNAIEHGNLEISAQEKHHAIETDHYDQLLADRRCNPRFTARRVRVIMTQDYERGVYECCIKDEGKGFHWQQWVVDQSPEDAPNGGCGRGIVLTRGAAHAMAYNDRGNEVVLTVRMSRALCGD